MRYSWKRNVARALVATICVSGASFATIAATYGKNGTVSITAEMEDASPLRNGNKVRASGVEVGTIDSVTLGPDRKPVVAMTVGREVLPLHQDATATVTQADLLGERYVAIDPGTPSSPVMPEPYNIQIKQTRSVTDLQQVVDMVDDPAGTGLGMLMTTLGEGLGTNPEQTNATIKAIRPALQQTNELAQVLSDQNQVLSRLVQTAQPVADAVATKRGESLDHLVGSTTNLLQVTAQNRGQIQDSLNRLPDTLRSAQRTLSEVAGLAPPTTRSLSELRPITDNLVDISDELKDFSDAADPALGSLQPVLKKGKDLLDEARPVADDLRHGGNGLHGTLDSLHKLADGGLSTRLVDLMEFAKGWTLSIGDYDAVSHYFKAVLPYSPRTGGATVAGPIPGAPMDPTPKNLPLPKSGRLPIPWGNADGAPKEAYPAPRLPGDNGATGLSPSQEQGMMHQLIGGYEDHPVRSNDALLSVE